MNNSDKMDNLKHIVKKLWPLHRTLVSDGTDEALDYIGSCLPKCAHYTIETYTPGKPAWTWSVPKRYVVHEAYLETSDGERILDFRNNPLHLVSYSVAVDCELSWEELKPHLFYSEKRPNAIPWESSYYEPKWGFCLSKVLFDQMPRDTKYRVVIKSEFLITPQDGLRVGVATIHPEGGPCEDSGEILICAHVCHPGQANDDLSGVATAIGLANRLEKDILPLGAMSVRFLFCPETIGSICYFSQHEDLIPLVRGGIFCEMTGNKNTMRLQRSAQDCHLIDRIARHVMSNKFEVFNEGEFRDGICNDEMVINGPGVNIPCISVNRWPYEEYHTSEDTPDIISEEMLQESVDVVEDIVRIFCTDYRPLRNFRGPVFLSKFGLWVDWRENWALNRAIELIMMRLEGDMSIFEIAEELNLDYWQVREYVEKFKDHGLITKMPL